MGSVSDENERIVPTPEELEQGVLERRRRRSDGDGDRVSEVKPRRRLSLFRGRGVGRRRKYVTVDRATNSTGVTKEADGPTQPVVEPVEETKAPAPTSETAGGMRVRSVSVPTRRSKAPAKDKYEPYSKEAQFYRKAIDRGHQMGKLVPVSNTTNLEAVCVRCGMRGELVVVFEENWSNVTNHHFRGPAINRTCNGPTE